MFVNNSINIKTTKCLYCSMPKIIYKAIVNYSIKVGRENAGDINFQITMTYEAVKAGWLFI